MMSTDLDVKYIYTVADKGLLITQAVRSIKSLRKHVDKNEVFVFFTPPRSKLGYI